MKKERRYASSRPAPLHLLTFVLAGLLVGIAAFWIVSAVTQPHDAPPRYTTARSSAGQQPGAWLPGGFTARHGDAIVLTSTSHCTTESTNALRPDGTTVAPPASFGPAAPQIPRAHIRPARARASGLNYLAFVVARDRIPQSICGRRWTWARRARRPSARHAAARLRDICCDESRDRRSGTATLAETVTEKGGNLQTGQCPTSPSQSSPTHYGESGALGAQSWCGDRPVSRVAASAGALGFTPLAEAWLSGAGPLRTPPTLRPCRQIAAGLTARGSGRGRGRGLDDASGRMTPARGVQKPGEGDGQRRYPGATRYEAL